MGGGASPPSLHALPCLAGHVVGCSSTSSTQLACPLLRVTAGSSRSPESGGAPGPDPPPAALPNGLIKACTSTALLYVTVGRALCKGGRGPRQQTLLIWTKANPAQLHANTHMLSPQLQKLPAATSPQTSPQTREGHTENLHRADARQPSGPRACGLLLPPGPGVPCFLTMPGTGL